MADLQGRDAGLPRGTGALTRIATALAVLLLVAGCASHTATPPASGAVGPLADADPPVPEPTPTDSPLRAATGALAAFADHSTDADTWWRRLAPHLSPAARTAYARTDPALVPVHRLTGPPHLEPSTTAALATVTEDTDAGRYTVLLSLTDAGGWQVERLTPPAG